ncbi:MAG TPA: glycoside hydrolase domain-containing protein [Kofleriaceae bacterium]
MTATSYSRAIRAIAALAISTATACASDPPEAPEATAVAAASTVEVLRGTDRASVFSPGEAATLRNNFGVAWTGVYIGGPCNGGSGWTRDTVTAIAAATGWQFLPIFVGSQLGIGCSATTLGYAQGHSHGDQAASRMRAFGWDGGRDIPVVLDIERSTFDQNQGATTDYARGWLDAVHADGYRGYLYGSFTMLNAFASAGLPIDGAWVAVFLSASGTGGFENVSPYDARARLGGNFSTHNRAWQYHGSVSAPGAGQVDTDVSDFLLAPAPGGSNGGDCTAGETAAAAQFGCQCVDHQPSGGFCPGTGCTAVETNNFGAFGCQCVDHQGNGGFCPGSGCTALETNNAAAFGCQCVDHQPSGGFCPGAGCTALEANNAAAFGCQCVDHQPSGGFCAGTGCTALEANNAAAFGCQCVDHQPSGGFCAGTGCTAAETAAAQAVGCECVDHRPSGGFCAGTGCTAAETMAANAVGCDCRNHRPWGGFCPTN